MAEKRKRRMIRMRSFALLWPSLDNSDYGWRMLYPWKGDSE